MTIAPRPFMLPVCVLAEIRGAKLAREWRNAGDGREGIAGAMQMRGTVGG